MLKHIQSSYALECLYEKLIKKPLQIESMHGYLETYDGVMKRETGQY